MNENFKFAKLSKKHKRAFILYQITLFLIIAIMTVIAIKITNPKIIEPSDQMSLTIGAVLAFSVMALAFLNRLKSLLKIKFVAFLIIWVLLFSLQMIMTTLIWTIGLVLIPLMIDDLICLPLWKNLWYNTYE
jgi:hypothetical protein